MDFMPFLQSLGTKVLDSFDPIGLFHSGDSGPLGNSTSLSNLWDKFKNGETNNINYQIAQDNLDYQRERNKIEDARYEDETAYNRAWAEDERNYNRALQERLFEREDTAITRQAEELSKLGINPLSQQMNGLNAGTQVSGAVEPTMSSRGGSALHNDFQMQGAGAMEALSSMLSLQSTINQVATGQQQRDSLALQNDKQFLENLSRANQLGIKYQGLFPAHNEGGYLKQNKNGHITTINLPDGRNLFDSNEYKSASFSAYRQQRKDSMPTWQYTLDSLGNNDVYNQAEKALTKGSQLFDRVFENITDSATSKFNPFATLLNLFF